MFAATTGDMSLRKKYPEDIDTQLNRKKKKKEKNTKENWKQALALSFSAGLLCCS